MVDLLLVSEETGGWFTVGVGVAAGRCCCWGPEVDGAIVAGGYKSFDELVGGCCGFFEAGLGEGEFGGGIGWVRPCVVVVGGAENEVGGQRKVVNPVGMCGEGLRKGAGVRIPDLDCFVVR